MPVSPDEDIQKNGLTSLGALVWLESNCAQVRFLKDGRVSVHVGCVRTVEKSLLAAVMAHVSRRRGLVPLTRGEGVPS